MEDFIIENKRSKYFLPSVPFWIMDDMHLDTVEGQLYSIILTKGYLTWNTAYIADVLRCSESRIKRIINKLVDIGSVAKRNLRIGQKERRVLAARYTAEGKRSEVEIKNLLDQGEVKIRKLYV